MAGTLRAEATLAAANLVYLLLLVSGGIAVPLDRFPDRPGRSSRRCRPARCRRGCARCSATAHALPWWTSASSSAGPRSRGVLAARTFRWE